MSFTNSYSNVADVCRPGFVKNTSQSWLGASPDAIVTKANGEKVLIEIKYPYTARDLTVEEAMTRSKVSAYREQIQH